MSNCACIEWCADATSGTATSESANSARMLKRVIFAPEKKELRAESYTRRSTETNRLAAVTAFRWPRRRGRGVPREIGRALHSRSRGRCLAPTLLEQRKRGSHEH